MDYAIIRLKGQQFKVSKGDEILVGKVNDKKFDAQMLMLVKDGKVVFGKPEIAKNTLKLKILDEEEKGDKLHVRKFRSKSRYRKTIGFRPKYTRLQIESI